MMKVMTSIRWIFRPSIIKTNKFFNRWQYTDLEKGLVGFFNLRYLEDEKQSGEVDFDPELHRLTTNYWGVRLVLKGLMHL
jgi:hypothetical protein